MECVLIRNIWTPTCYIALFAMHRTGGTKSQSTGMQLKIYRLAFPHYNYYAQRATKMASLLKHSERLKPKTVFLLTYSLHGTCVVQKSWSQTAQYGGFMVYI